MNIRLFFGIATFGFITTFSMAEEPRTWTNRANGRQFSGTFVSATDTSVSIRRAADNVVFEVKKADLAQADVDWISQRGAKAPAGAAAADLSGLIAAIPAANGAPAVSVLLIDKGETRGLGAVGIRKAGSKDAVEIADKWHLGSCTKSMTATLAASFVEEGVITWETTVGEVLGKKMKILKDYEPVTLGLLLANRGGVPGKVPDSVFGGVDQGAPVKDLSDREMLKQRAGYAEAVLNVPPSSPPGTSYQYSNAGFVIAGVMLEMRTGKPWEKLIEERLFKPLGMANSGFGSAARDDKRNATQPWPHKDAATSIPPGPGDDNSWVIGPAGTVHCSLKDIARYISMHASREIGPVLKKKESFVFLHTAVPDNDDYARGWIVARAPWSQGPVISHDGSNTMNHCSFWIAPERQAAVAAFTNCGEKGSDICRAAIKAVVDAHLK